MPNDYKTSTGALNKSRALQYCWEDLVNLVSDDEWIIHLDEETLVTTESVKGILKFIRCNQKYSYPILYFVLLNLTFKKSRKLNDFFLHFPFFKTKCKTHIHGFDSKLSILVNGPI